MQNEKVIRKKVAGMANKVVVGKENTMVVGKANTTMVVDMVYKVAGMVVAPVVLALVFLPHFAPLHPWRFGQRWH